MSIMASLFTFIVLASIFVSLANKINRKAKLLYTSRVVWVVGLYLVVLMGCVAVLAIFPDRGMMPLKKVSEKAFMKANEEFYNTISKGETEKVNPSYVRNKWVFEYHSSKLRIVKNNNEDLFATIFIEKKKTNDGKIEATYYRTDTASVNGLAIDVKIVGVRADIKGDTLMLSNQEKRTVELNQIENNMAVKQFTGDASFFHHESSVSFGQSILYMRIPRDLVLEDTSNLNFQYVE